MIQEVLLAAADFKHLKILVTNQTSLCATITQVMHLIKHKHADRINKEVNIIIHNQLPKFKA